MPAPAFELLSVTSHGAIFQIRNGEPFEARDCRFEATDRGLRAADAGTPGVRDIEVCDVSCSEVRHSAGFVLGLPERPVENLRLAGYRVSFAAAAGPGCPDMAASIGPVARQGLYLCNVRGVALDDVAVEGADGPAVLRENVA